MLGNDRKENWNSGMIALSEYYTYVGLSRYFNGVIIFFACLDLEQKS
jgi:hypothetical protein